MSTFLDYLIKQADKVNYEESQDEEELRYASSPFYNRLTEWFAFKKQKDQSKYR